VMMTVLEDAPGPAARGEKQSAGGGSGEGARAQKPRRETAEGKARPGAGRQRGKPTEGSQGGQRKVNSYDMV